MEENRTSERSTNDELGDLYKKPNIAVEVVLEKNLEDGWSRKENANE